MKNKKFLLVLVPLLFVGTGAQAVGLRLLEFSPAKYFTAEDWEQAKQTAGKALKQGKVGETFSWQGDSSGHKGTYTVLNIQEEEGRSCRDLQIQHVAGNVRGGGDYRFCLTDGGEWKTQGRVPAN